jgi:hypothetical protein
VEGKEGFKNLWMLKVPYLKARNSKVRKIVGNFSTKQCTYVTCELEKHTTF